MPPAAQAAVLALIQRYEQRLQALQEQVAQLTERLNQNSTNSSRPPSSPHFSPALTGRLERGCSACVGAEEPPQEWGNGPLRPREGANGPSPGPSPVVRPSS